jgi:hypothetical protein
MTDQNIETVRALIARFFNAHDPQAAPEFLTEDFWWTGGSVGTIEGRAAYQEVMGHFWAATGKPVSWPALMIYKFRDGKVARQWAAEDWVAILTQIGDYTPPWQR